MSDVELALGDKAAIYEHPTSLGDVTLKAHYDDHGEVTAIEVLHADPRVLISGQILRDITRWPWPSARPAR